jgi:hypothetical protein
MKRRVGRLRKRRRRRRVSCAPRTRRRRKFLVEKFKPMEPSCAASSTRVCRRSLRYAGTPSHISPYRSWCPHCVRGQGKDSAHRRAESVGKFPEFSWDYCFPGDEEGHKITILVGKERRTGMVMAATIPRKGSTGLFATQRCLEFINECGAAEAKILVKSDAEPAILALVSDIKKARVGLETIEETSPVGSSGSNGKVERAVQSVEGQLRTMKSALEEKMNREIQSEEKIVLFMSEHCGYLWNRLHVGEDGLTNYESEGQEGVSSGRGVRGEVALQDQAQEQAGAAEFPLGIRRFRRCQEVVGRAMGGDAGWG